MEDKRFEELVTRITNFDWMPPFDWDGAFCAVNPGYAHLLVPYYSPAVRPPDSEYDEYRKLLREFCLAPSAMRDAEEEFKKRLREFRRALRLDFAEWHFHSHQHPRVGGGTFTVAGNFAGDPKRVQDDLRRIWELASTKDNDAAVSSLLRMKMQFSRRLKHLDAQAHNSNGWEHDKRALGLMMETLEWLQKRLGRLKVCENPKCHRRKYFFKVYNNDRYCCPQCVAKAKALREAKRAPKKEPVLSEETRYKMKIAAEKRWAKRKREERRKGSSPARQA
jgi:hypothetical protein